MPPDPEDLTAEYFGPIAHTREGRARGRPRAAERAVGPLRREIERTLSYALAAARDPRLRDLAIAGVEPAPDASCFEVTVAAAEPLGAEERAAVAASLDAARGTLRSEIARSLQRKRTPELRFAIAAVMGGARDPEEGEP